MNSAGGCCGGSFNPLKVSTLKNKLGKCPMCMFLSAIGTVFSWSFFIPFYFIAHDEKVYKNLFYVGVFFSLLLLAHGIAYWVINRKKGES